MKTFCSQNGCEKLEEPNLFRKKIRRKTYQEPFKTKRYFQRRSYKDYTQHTKRFYQKKPYQKEKPKAQKISKAKER